MIQEQAQEHKFLTYGKNLNSTKELESIHNQEWISVTHIYIHIYNKDDDIMPLIINRLKQ